MRNDEKDLTGFRSTVFRQNVNKPLYSNGMEPMKTCQV